jgi:hypothetical protein
MPRKKTFQTFREAGKTGAYDERPMLPDSIDIQVHMCRNDHTQPFFLVCEKDTLLCQMSGEGRVEFKDTPVNYHPLIPGDFIYVPAGAPHRLVPDGENVTLRYKAQDAGLEGVAWYCDDCGNELFRDVWDTAVEISHAAYLRVTNQFNESTGHRTCGRCNLIHEPIDLSRYRWQEIAEEIREERAKAA